MATGLEKFSYDLATKLEAESASNTQNSQNSTVENSTVQSSENSQASQAAAAAAAAAAASRLLSLQRDLGAPVSSPMDFLKQLEASTRGRGGFDRLLNLAGFGFPGVLPPLTPISADGQGPDLKSEDDRMSEKSSHQRGKS